MADMPVGVDYAETAMFFARCTAGRPQRGRWSADHAGCPGDSRHWDEVTACLTQAAAMVDGVYHMIYEELKPGVRENDIVAMIQQDAVRNGLGRCGGDQRDFWRTVQPASA